METNPVCKSIAVYLFVIISALVRIIETYHHDRKVTKKPRRSFKLLFTSFAFIVAVTGVTFFFTKNTDFSTPAVLQANNKDNTVLAAESEGSVTKEYDFSSIQMPAEGQTAFRVSGGRTWSSGTDYRAPMASITKVVTALTVLEKAPLEQGQAGDTITFNQQDEQYYLDYLSQLGTVTGVTAGQTITEYEALQAILLASSNNMAATLADHYYQNKESFIVEANSMLRDLGLNDTLVADASGFNPGSVSTPSDLLKLGEIALENPTIAEIVAQEEAYITGDVRIPNYNALIGFDEITGIKPGFTDEAGYCLLFSADFPNKDGETEQFIAVVTGVIDKAAYYDALTSIYEGAKQAIASQNGR